MLMYIYLWIIFNQLHQSVKIRKASFKTAGLASVGKVSEFEMHQ